MVAQKFSHLFALLCLGLTACKSGAFQWDEDPAGYVLARDNGSSNLPILHYKGSGENGLKIQSFENPVGGTLPYWTSDLATKLQGRGYELQNSSIVLSRNEVAGIQLDFRYAPRASDHPADLSYFSAVLFVTDAYRVVMQLAGPVNAEASSRAEIPEILSRVDIGGCERKSEVCGREHAEVALQQLRASIAKTAEVPTNSAPSTN